ncbi:unnamed protein product, partial [Brenthis ino]
MPNRHYDEPNQSDATLLVSVEDLIYRALGSPNENTVNFKLVQMILHILARQQRMLEQRVEIREEDFEVSQPREKSTSTSSSSKSPRTPGRKKMAGIKEEREPKKKDTDKKKDAEKEKEEKETKHQKEKAELISKKEQKSPKELEKIAKKDKEKAEKERKQAEKEREKSPVSTKGGEKTKIAVTESRPRASIDVVTQSQFAVLEATVNELKSLALPKPLALPDNEQLKSDLARGSASLPDTMQAMQVDARVKAAEEAINRMTGILTQLTAAGGLSEDLADKVEEVITEHALETVEAKPSELKPAEETSIFTISFSQSVKSRPSIAVRKSVSVDPKISQAPLSRPSSVSTPVTPKPSQATTSKASIVSRISSMFTGPGVTHEEMNAALKALRNELSKNLENLTTRAITAAENALHTAKVVADRLDIALKLDLRISTLYSLVGDYAEQLSGFDDGLTTQMQSFQDQMAQIRTDLKNGLSQLENVNNNAEGAAVIELTERYQDLVTELDSTLHAHKALTTLQSELGGEMHSLVECVEMLREQKCDRDEVLDGLRDKADATRLAGLLTEIDFAAARADFERRIELCHDKFRRQEAVWMAAIRDLTHITDHKAELVELLSARDDARRRLRELHARRARRAAVYDTHHGFFKPSKAALLTREVSAGAVCGACGAAALMAAHDAARGAPARLPALRPPPEDDLHPPCISDWIGPEPPSDKHVCRRWCGGSHTLLAGAAPRERAPPGPPPAPSARAPPGPPPAPSARYAGYGEDGRLYMMEEELKPCLECNLLSTEAPPAADGGAGDSPASRPPTQDA